MDDCLAQVAIDFEVETIGETNFKRVKWLVKCQQRCSCISLNRSDGAKANINIKAEGVNEHHKIEAIFKAFAKAIKVAVNAIPKKNDFAIDQRML
jgi:imidazoleglycerol-phosphate dehydratase/histidinol-phosphatase